MEETGVKRKLAVILAADVAGYSRLMGADEEATLKTLGAYRQIIDGAIAGHDGRIFATAGDSVVAEFASPVEAVRTAIFIQEELGVRNGKLPDERKMHFRIGINLGDVMVEGDNLLGDGVNIAARLEGLADPGGVCVSDMVYQSVEAKLDLAFEDLGAQSVKNIAKPVRAWRVKPGLAASAAISREPPKSQVLPRLGVLVFVAIAVAALGITGAAIWNSYQRPASDPPGKPSIAVLPFDNMSGDPEQEYFSDGITEDLITDLAKISGLTVIARNSSFTYKGKAVKVEQIARELGVRYVLEGSVRKAGNRIRITAQFIDAGTGNHLWAERYDRELKDIFALQDEITEKIVAALKVKLSEGEQQRIARKYTDNLEAYDHFLRARGFHGGQSKQSNAVARQLLEKAIELDPKFAAAYAELSWVLSHAWFTQWNVGPQYLDRALEMAQKAVALDDSLPDAHARLAWILVWKKQYQRAVAAGRRAIALDPNYADGYLMLGHILIFAGESSEEAIRVSNEGMRLDPHSAFHHLLHIADGYWTMGQYEEALANLKRAVTLRPGFMPSRLWLAVVYASLDRLEEARREVAEVLRLAPRASVESQAKMSRYKDKAVKGRFIEALRKAGLPERSPAVAPAAAPAKPKAKSKTALALPAKPSIAVLPFTNMSTDPEQGYFSDGMTDDLITDLAKISGLFVIARNSVFTYKGRAVKVQKVASELGVRYVLEGSVRKAGGRVRINAQLVDAITGRHLWAERYDREYKAIFALQDEITAKIVSALAVELTDGEKAGRAARKQRTNLQAHETFLRAKQYLWRFTTKDTAKAKELFEKAIALDPSHARAHAALGRLHYNEWEIWGKARDRNLARALELGRKAAALDDSLAGAHLLLTQVYRFRREFEQSDIEADKALALDPTDADTLAGLGDVLRWSGRAPEAIGLLQKAMRLDPFYPAWYEFYLGQAYFLTGRYDQAIEALKRGAKRNSNYPAFPLFMAASFAMLGRTEEARAAAAEVLRINPDFTLQAYVAHVPYRNQADVDRDLAAFRKAGLPN